MNTQPQRVTDEPEIAPPAPTRITRVTIGRVHNWGNYENKRFEVSAEVGAGDDPAKVILEIEAALDALAKPEGSSWDVERSRKVLATPVSELTSYQIENLSAHKEILAKAEAAQKQRAGAFNALSRFGGVSEEHRDAKDNWEDEDDDRY